MSDPFKNKIDELEDKNIELTDRIEYLESILIIVKNATNLIKPKEIE